MPLSGLISIFYSPGQTLEEAAANSQRPWVLPLVAAILIATLTNVMVVQRIGLGTLIRNQLESSKIGQRLGPEGINKVVQDAESSTFQKTMTWLGPAVGIPAFLAIVTGIAYALLLAMGGLTNYWAVVASWAWALWPVLLVKGIGSAIFLLSVTDYAGVDAQHLFLTSVGAFLDKETVSAPVRTLAGALDVLGIWAIFLQTVGLQKFSRQVTRGKALAASLIVYVGAVLIQTGWAAMFG